MRKIYILVSCTVLFFGCSSQEDNKPKEVQRDASDIVVTKQDVKKHDKTNLHKKELKADNKDFYYSLKEKNINTDTTDKSYTKLDAQKNIKNRDQKDKIVDRKRVDTPYNYIKIDLLKSSLSKEFIVKCSSCHDDYANGIIGPSLLHKDGEFIFNRLKAYKQKEKVNVLMKDLVAKMSDRELKNISNEIAKFNENIRKMDKEKL